MPCGRNLEGDGIKFKVRDELLKNNDKKALTKE
jgi:hypothetical protein